MRSHRPTYVAWLGATTTLVLAFAALAQAEEVAPAQAADQDGAVLYATKTCIACHGKDAKTPILPEYPKLAGQNEAYLLQQMTDIKSGARNNGNTPAMSGVMHLVNEAEMATLAGYIAALAP